MAGLHDLAARVGSTPFPALGRFPEQMAAGQSWIWLFGEWVDDDGVQIDFSTCTATCSIVEVATGQVLVSPIFTGAADGTATLEVDEADTELAPVRDGIRAQWGLSITDGVDSVAFWVPSDSPFLIVAAN